MNNVPGSVQDMKKIKTILARIETEIDGLSFDANDRNNLSAALFHISIEHSKSVIVLLKKTHHASAYALVRPMFECFVRAAWIQHCATDSQISELLKKDEFPLNFGQMIEAVEKNQDWVEALSEIKKAALNSLHSFTHGGMQIIARRFQNGELFHAPDSVEIKESVKFVALLSFLSFCQILSISQTEDKADVIKELFDDICMSYLERI